MRAPDIIHTKRLGREHTEEEIRWLVDGYVAGAIPDYQLSAWLMAVCFTGLSRRETFTLTDAMARSGDMIDLSCVGPVVADKHSTGGVGDKVSLVLGPLVASCGLPFAKMSGRGLGHTGGTVDKLESIKGFRTEMDIDEFRTQVTRVGMVMVGQTPGLVPADRLLYALRDVTATVEQESLIASSIMSKKIAAGATTIVLDVKVGEGAFLHDIDQARKVARTMIDLGRDAGRDVRAILSDMEEPLGLAVGNALEVREAFDVLAANGPADLRDVVLTLAAHLLVMAGSDDTLESARRKAATHLDDGKALEMARSWIAAQGGDPGVVEGAGLPVAPVVAPVKAVSAGSVRRVDAMPIAEACLMLGAGRELKGAPVDHAVGVVLDAPRGTEVGVGSTLAFIHARRREHVEMAEPLVRSAFHIGADTPAIRDTILEEILKGDE